MSLFTHIVNYIRMEPKKPETQISEAQMHRIIKTYIQIKSIKDFI